MCCRDFMRSCAKPGTTAASKLRAPPGPEGIIGFMKDLALPHCFGPQSCFRVRSLPLQLVSHSSQGAMPPCAAEIEDLVQEVPHMVLCNIHKCKSCNAPKPSARRMCKMCYMDMSFYVQTCELSPLSEQIIWAMDLFMNACFVVHRLVLSCRVLSCLVFKTNYCTVPYSNSITAMFEHMRTQTYPADAGHTTTTHDYPNANPELHMWCLGQSTTLQHFGRTWRRIKRLQMWAALNTTSTLVLESLRTLQSNMLQTCLHRDSSNMFATTRTLLHSYNRHDNHHYHHHHHCHHHHIMIIITLIKIRHPLWTICWLG